MLLGSESNTQLSAEVLPMAKVEPTLMQWLQESMQNQKSYDSDSVIPLVYSKGKTEAK